ncbi:MAG TPA: hypothetical protein VMS98_10435 [Thermoanaerobaculia bacterium]|nr:hypothetical protein [Thermoanaerobaculia bacterium]
MRFEIEKTPLSENSARTDVAKPVGVEFFEVPAESAEAALKSFISRDRTQLLGEQMTLGEETLATIRRDDGTFLLRLSPLQETAAESRG